MDGLPAGVHVPLERVQTQLDRRSPGRSRFSSRRREPDRVLALSGLDEGEMSLGSPIVLMVRNRDARSRDYDALAGLFRPGHADLTMFLKHGFPPLAGGGRASGRETVGRVAAGAVAGCFLEPLGIAVRSCTLRAGDVDAGTVDLDFAATNPLACPDPRALEDMERAVDECGSAGDSLGGVVGVYIEGVPPGLGSPVFAKLDAMLACAMMSIGGVKGVEIGGGFSLTRLRGSAANDPIGPGFCDGRATACGGILGGISTGGLISLRLAVKPTPTIGLEQATITTQGVPATLAGVRGRHDPFLCHRIGPVSESMALMVMADAVLQRRSEVCPADALSGSGRVQAALRAAPGGVDHGSERRYTGALGKSVGRECRRDSSAVGHERSRGRSGT